MSLRTCNHGHENNTVIAPGVRREIRELFGDSFRRTVLLERMRESTFLPVEEHSRHDRLTIHHRRHDTDR